jgi:hypothetical protein
MYGVEAATGLGGLAAQQPGGDVFLPAALRIRPQGSALIGGPPQSGTLLPSTTIGDMVALPTVSAGGGQVEQPTDRQLGGWQAILDWHSSPAPWILGMLLILYAWLHAAHRGGGPRPR